MFSLDNSVSVFVCLSVMSACSVCLCACVKVLRVRQGKVLCVRQGKVLHCCEQSGKK